jgi:hypothetical protein
MEFCFPQQMGTQSSFARRAPIREWFGCVGTSVVARRGRDLIDPFHVRGEIRDQPDPVVGVGATQHPHLLVGLRKFTIMFHSCGIVAPEALRANLSRYDLGGSLLLGSDRKKRATPA